MKKQTAPAAKPAPAIDTVTRAAIGQFLARRNWSEIRRGDLVVLQTVSAGQIAATVIDPDLDGVSVRLAGSRQIVVIDPATILRTLARGVAA